ncbi:hypothetical protein SODALDRAFT_331075 [Sodiomyces alkalinus F11]|uniref:DNA excision repair protein n=1 Tax=Sodiomyces alkalinus (strain CBS 110278 / VKM F-3762 / F11) TaxID=1314773 RepID=A0A3N2Q3K8_SODAK|nr:hypothetical protein SODALDRAFT_331075 [Sodiomyces alkalinus F11]ROT41354.1 hypothetical protein SODALDRAFT_331075 [Sodiomyces alkalinus F11]
METENGDDVILLSDDETASDSGPEVARAPFSSTKALGKRKVRPDFEEKVVWDDDSDDGLQLASKSKKRRGGKKRGREHKGQEKNKGKGKAQKDSNREDVKGEPSISAGAQDDYAMAGAPVYLRERRQEFDKTRESLHEAGLLLPPDYTGIEFTDNEDESERPGRGAVEERPQFDDSTGVKPCRPYEDVELESSAGVIPAPIAQYLREYQITGVRFLHRLFVYQEGGILGDDMGLGKTVQVAAFLTAAFGKSGTKRDQKRMRKMRRDARRWYPRVLIVCPGSLLENWKNELHRWGWWHVDVYHGSGKEDVLGAARAGMVEIMITTYQTYKMQQDAVNTVKWDVVVADECHIIKRPGSEVTKAMDQANALCRIGLTGTAIQNNYGELWTLLNWTNPGHFGTWSEWERTIAKPLRLGQSHDATLHQLSRGRITAKKLVTNLLPPYFLRRVKTLIAHQLPKKSDRVVFCPLTDAQREAYKNLIDSPELDLLRTVGDRCECGSGAARGWCCDERLPNGKHWKSIVFPSVMTLQKLANHLTLLVPSSTAADPSEKQEREMATLRTCCPDTWAYLFTNRDAIMNLANPEFCGKWKVLKKLLKFWHSSGDKVLVFSHSVRLLRILQHLFRNTSYSVTYLDGSLSYADRQGAVDEFNSDPTQFVFLISTKAGGVGLNITAANKVVIFDPHWNPAYDLQAQDRAYRIGQRRDVDVFRLVSSGTIEEIVYARQIYKQQQANIGYTASSERRYFKGVQETLDRKGEIFGLANLFAYREDHLVIRDIVNKTNIAEAKAGTGIALVGLDMEQAVNDEELQWIKQEAAPGEGAGAAGSAEDGGMSQLAALITKKTGSSGSHGPAQQNGHDSHQSPKSDAIQAILASAGVEYTHENSEVIGTSKVEEKLSRAAEMVAAAQGGEGGGGGGGDSGDGTNDEDDVDGDSALLADAFTREIFGTRGQGRGRGRGTGFLYRYNPPEDVMRRQFCTMAREFGFASATQFALVVESWTQEQRRNCLDAFYRIREGRLLAQEAVDRESVVGLDSVALHRGPQGHGSVFTDGAAPVDKTKTEVKNDVKEEGRSVLWKVPAMPPPPPPSSSSAVSEKKRSSIFIYDSDDDETDEL